MPLGYELIPGDGSWMFNSIVTTAKQGLAPTHVPPRAADDLESAASERVVSSPTRRPRKKSRGKARRAKRKPTIKPEFKEVLRKSADYADWLKLKQEFLRENKMLFGRPANLGEDARQQPEKIPLREVEAS